MATFQLGIALGAMKDATGATETIKEVRLGLFAARTKARRSRFEFLCRVNFALTPNTNTGGTDLRFYTEGIRRSHVPLRTGRPSHSARSSSRPLLLQAGA
jgi:hypothetical protein